MILSRFMFNQLSFKENKMKKILLMGLIAFLPLSVLANQFDADTDKEIQNCTDKPSSEAQQECLENLIQKTVEEKKKIETNLLSWKYEEKQDKLRNTTLYFASKFSNEAKDLTKSKRDVGILHLISKGNKNMVSFIPNDHYVRCDKPCEISYRFDENPVETILVVAVNTKQLAIIDDSQLIEFTNKLKKSKTLILELPTKEGNKQYEFSVDGLNWPYF